jgi:soluble lytic murein transglycosylase
MTRLARFLVGLTIGLAACGSSRERTSAGEVGSVGDRDLARAIAQSDVLKDAQALIDRGHPWRATQLLAPILRDPQKRTPAALIVAARAAAGWGGSADVDKLLASESWIDSEFGGEPRELLTRAALERGADTTALTHASAGMRDAREPDARATRLVLLARALERNNFFDSAAANYSRAAGTFPSIHDWLQLRVAGTERDSAKRAAAYATVTLPVARPRIAWTEAQTRERLADALGASARYAALGATVISLRLRLSVAPDSATRDVVKSELLAFIRTHNGSADAKSAVEVLDKGFTSFAPAEELIIARSAAVNGPPARAVAAFERALSQPSLLTASDRISFAQSLARLDRTRDALAQLGMIDGPLAGQAAYQRARILLTSGTADATRAALRDVVDHFPDDTVAASAALYLLADLVSDGGNDDQARALFRQLSHKYPTSPRAADGWFQGALIALIHDNAKAAASEFDSLTARMPRSDDALSARYWSGRAWAAAGDQAAARQRWREVIAQQPRSYYAVVAARRLQQAPWVPESQPDSFPRVATVDSAMARIALLERLGMDAEARLEYDALEEQAPRSPDRLIATAHAFLEHDQSSRAIRLAQRLIDSGARDPRAYRLLFPVLDRDELTRDAKAHGLDPAFVAAIIRQESNFNPHATSVAGARGLMQVLPSVGAEVSRSLRFPVWNSALLYDADANLQIGTAHLAAFVKQYDTTPRILAAYNAGGSRVSRWSAKPGVDDPEVFAERISFSETRDYVRLVQRNQAIYKALYAW